MRIVVQIHTTYLFHTIHTDSPENAYAVGASAVAVDPTDLPRGDPVWSTSAVEGYANRVLFASPDSDGRPAVYFYTNEKSFPSPLG